MKRLFLPLALCALVAVGCNGGAKKDAAAATADAETSVTAFVGEPFTFDELFRIFSCFGEDVMSPIFAPQSVKDGIKNELQQNFGYVVESNEVCSALSYSLPDGEHYKGFQMAAYRRSDGGVRVLLEEGSISEVTTIDYLRAFDYDPATQSVREVEFTLRPVPEPDDFEDQVRLAGSDVSTVREAARNGITTITSVRAA